MHINKYDEKWRCPFYKDDEDEDVYNIRMLIMVMFIYIGVKILMFNYGDDKCDVYLNYGDDIGDV